MEKEKTSFFKILMTFVFVIAVFGGFSFVIIGEFADNFPVKLNYISYACVCACFLFSLLFIRKDKKKILITLALATNVAADYFLILMPSEENKLIGTCVFCGVQFFYFLYTLCLNKGIGTRIVNIAVRVALCLVAYFVLPNFFTLGTLEWVAVMYILNFFVNLVETLFHIKTEWLLFFGLLLYFACDIFVGLTNGGVEILGITGAFVDFISTYDIAFYCYIPGLFLIATSSVWAKKN